MSDKQDSPNRKPCQHSEDVCENCMEKKLLVENKEKLENIPPVKEKHMRIGFFISLFAGFATGIALRKLLKF